MIATSRPEILETIEARIRATPKIVIEASAGTGKTFTLEHLVVDLVLRGIPLPEILVVTFTDKATGELRRRIRAKLVELEAIAEGREPAVTGGASRWELDDEARTRLSRALRDFDRASLSTIHGFCQRILAEQSFATGRFMEESPIDRALSFDQAFNTLVRTRFAVTPEERPLLAAWLEKRSLDDLRALLWEALSQPTTLHPPYDPAALTEALAAIGSLEPVREELATTKLHGATKKAIVSRLDTVAACLDAAAGLPPFEQLQALQPLLDEKVHDLIDNYLTRDGLGPRCQGLLPKLERLDAALVPLASLAAARFAPILRERIAADKRERGEYDFEDMLTLLRDALVSEQGSALIGALRERYQAALIDEFQDTDPVQWTIIRKIFFESPTHRLYLIGDPKQAIYRFRGADVATYLTAREAVAEATGETPLPLRQTFRATAALIEGYNRIFDDEASPRFFSGAIHYPHPVTCGRPELGLLDETGAPAPPIAILPIETGATRAQAIVIPELGARIAREIAAITDPLRPALRFGEGARAEPIRLGEISILVKSGTEGSLVAEALAEAGVPHAFYKRSGLFQSDEAIHLGDLLETILDPGNRKARLRALLSPLVGLSLESLPLPLDLAGTEPGALLEGWRGEAEAGEAGPLFARIARESRLRALEERPHTNFLHLFEWLTSEQRRLGATLPELLQLLRARAAEEDAKETENLMKLETEKDAVQIMTMHVSKGLEATVVFVVGGINAPKAHRLTPFHDATGERCAWIGKPPAAVARAAQEETSEEDQRLFYVALTRARGRLYLPFYRESDEAPFTPDAKVIGPYACVNRRLGALLSSGSLTFHEPPEPPPAGTPEPPAPAIPPARETEAPCEYAPSHRGYVTTSFSRMQALAESDASENTDDRLEPPLTADTPLSADALPPGAETGIFLHALLAELPLEAVRRVESAEGLLRDPTLRPLIDSACDRYEVPRRARRHAAELLHAALRTPLGEGCDPVASASRVLREASFHFPLPERNHPLLGLSASEDRARFTIGRGLVKGFLDLVFEANGRVFWGDWKTNLLPAYTPETVAATIEEHYRLQAKLYTLAVLRMLGVRDASAYEARFGGFYFFFLRGMPEAGLYFERPGFDTVIGWQNELLPASGSLS